MKTTINTQAGAFPGTHVPSFAHLDSRSFPHMKEMVMNLKRSAALVMVVLMLASVLHRSATAAMIGEPVPGSGIQHSYGVLSPSTWDDANTQALALGGHLVAVNSPAEATWVVNTFGDNGARALWTNIPGHTVDLPHYGEAFCGVVEFDAIAIANETINPANHHIYRLLSPSTWADANAKAKALGGSLVKIDDPAEARWVEDTFSNCGGVQRQLWIAGGNGRTLGLPHYGAPFCGVVEVDLGLGAQAVAAAAPAISTQPMTATALSATASTTTSAGAETFGNNVQITTATKRVSWGQLKAHYR